MNYSKDDIKALLLCHLNICVSRAQARRMIEFMTVDEVDKKIESAMREKMERRGK